MVQLNRGILCGKCSSPRTTVTQTIRGNRHIARYRQCDACGHRMKTIELHSTALPTDAKLDYLYKRPTK